jgi:hypothetical protein
MCGNPIVETPAQNLDVAGGKCSHRAWHDHYD